MKKYVMGTVMLVLFASEAFADNCRQELRNLRKGITNYERQTESDINYLDTIGEYLVKSGRSLKIQISSGGQPPASEGDTLVYSGNQVINSANKSLEESAKAADQLNNLTDALEDCFSKD